MHDLRWSQRYASRYRIFLIEKNKMEIMSSAKALFRDNEMCVEREKKVKK